MTTPGTRLTTDAGGPLLPYEDGGDEPEVYAPQADTRLLVEALRHMPPPAGAEVLDLGTGSGELALAAARHDARVTAVDLSARAVGTARRNAARAGLPVRVLHGDLFAPVAGRRFDLVLSNPP